MGEKNMSDEELFAELSASLDRALAKAREVGDVGLYTNALLAVRALLTEIEPLVIDRIRVRSPPNVPGAP